MQVSKADFLYELLHLGILLRWLGLQLSYFVRDDHFGTLLGLTGLGVFACGTVWVLLVTLDAELVAFDLAGYVPGH